jgi:hypothetical protein
VSRLIELFDVLGRLVDDVNRSGRVNRKTRGVFRGDALQLDFIKVGEYRLEGAQVSALFACLLTRKKRENQTK